MVSIVISFMQNVDALLELHHKEVAEATRAGFVAHSTKCWIGASPDERSIGNKTYMSSNTYTLRHLSILGRFARMLTFPLLIDRYA